MAPFQGSGVYVRIIDQSQGTGSSGYGATALMPLFTKRGNLFEKVTLQNYLDKVGYDLNFNPGYLGLKTLLQTMSEVTVWKLNELDYVSNILLLASGRYLSVWKVDDPDGLPSASFKYVKNNVTATGGYGPLTALVKGTSG